MRILLTGGTGYVGGRLGRHLVDQGHRVRCLVRRPSFLLTRATGVEIVAGDVLRYESLRPALRGCEAAYYLVHSLGGEGDFAAEERRGAENFARAARAEGVGRIVYLGGLGQRTPLPIRQFSRNEVGRILRESGVPTVELRASFVLGSGSLSFEMIRSLVECLPVLITPRWTRRLAQPIAVEDLIEYLVCALSTDLPESRVFEVGGADRVSYSDLMREYARQRGLRRWLVPVPCLSTGISSLWLGLITPLYPRIGRELIDIVRHESVVRDPSALSKFAVRPRGYREAVARALECEDRAIAETRWSDALSSRGTAPTRGGTPLGHRFVDSRVLRVPTPAPQAFAPIRCIGGRNGWYQGDWLWRLRGYVDLLFGGPGVRRGRRDPERLHVGDTVDFWRVEGFEENRRLRLMAEMRVPGRAWLQFEVEPDGRGGSVIRQTAEFDPAGLLGLLYWYAVSPFHSFIFSGMLREIARRGERGTGQEPGG